MIVVAVAVVVVVDGVVVVVVELGVESEDEINQIMCQ